MKKKGENTSMVANQWQYYAVAPTNLRSSACDATHKQTVGATF